jgi:hypothetical protein
MYFTTFNHYDDNDIMYDNHYNIIYNNEQCLICWDKYTTNNNVYKMQSLFSSMYYTSCTCNGYFHQNCLMKWIYKTNSCPICRIKLEIEVHENLPLTFNILKIYKLFKLFFTFILIKILYNIIFNIQYAVEKKIQNEQYTQL